MFLICFTKQILNSWIHTVTMRTENLAYQFLQCIYCTYPITKKADAVYNTVCICKWQHAKSKLSCRITNWHSDIITWTSVTQQQRSGTVRSCQQPRQKKKFLQQWLWPSGMW